MYDEVGCEGGCCNFGDEVMIQAQASPKISTLIFEF